MIALDLYKPKVKFDFKTLLVSLSAYCVIAGTMAQVLKSNYHNFYYCVADFIDQIRLNIIESVGYDIGQTIYVLGASVVTIAFSSLSYLLYAWTYNFINKD